MLTSLRIKNFKAWRDTGPIRLAPLTVIFGSNSAGKSSLGHLLLGLKQTALSTDRKRALHLGITAVSGVGYKHVVNPGTCRAIRHGKRWVAQVNRSYTSHIDVHKTPVIKTAVVCTNQHRVFSGANIKFCRRIA